MNLESFSSISYTILQIVIILFTIDISLVKKQFISVSNEESIAQDFIKAVTIRYKNKYVIISIVKNIVFPLIIFIDNFLYT